MSWPFPHAPPLTTARNRGACSISWKTAFLLLIIGQLLHSLEEYRFALWEVFAPARAVSGLFSGDLPTGFAIANTAIVSFGFWCLLFPVRRSWRGARAVLWAWVVLELLNGTGHMLLGLTTQSYFPGLYTAPLLFVTASYLAFRLLQERTEATAA